MALINSLILWLTKKRQHQIELFIKYPHEVQAEWMRKLLQAGRDTEWGRKYGYKDIENYDQYRNTVPLNDYDSLKPMIDRLRKGEQNILWNTDIKWFAKSSGTTTDRSKFIPVSVEALEECHYKGGKDLINIYQNNFPDTIMFTGKGLALGGSHHISEINNDAYYGDLSAIIIKNLPFWADFVRTPRASIALMDKWEEKIEKMAQVTKDHNVTSLSGVPSWTLLLIKHVLEITGKDDLMDVWPDLEVFFHGGVNFDPYREQFRQITLKKPLNYVNTYNASEGFFGIQDTKNSDDMLLMLDYGIFYEFLPMEEVGRDNPKVLGLSEVEKDVNYAIVISTNAGLWRYVIGDTIKFTSLDPFRIRITGRTRSFINATGEELIIENANNALKIACDKSGAIVNEYTAAPHYFSNGNQVAHQWLIEFEKPPVNLEFFKETFDNALKSLNSDYEAKRYHDMILKEPEIIVLPENTFYKWLKTKGKLGGQHKVPRLSNERQYVDEILEMIRDN